jgi:cytochrome c
VSKLLKAALLGAIAVIATSAATVAPKYGFGTPVTPAQLASWDIDVNGKTGAGLPPGHGSVAEGTKIWEAKCSTCHGEFGEGAGRFPVIAGGRGSLKDPDPVKTVGSYWPYAPTLFDYIRRAMPFPQPQSLTPDEVYALTAYILNLNDIVPKDAVLDATSLAAVKMPNRDGFIQAEWDTKNVACMKNCAPEPVRITSDLAHLNVTPDEREIGNVGSTVDLASIATPAPQPVDTHAKAVAFDDVKGIIAQRCTVCHSAKPTQAGFFSAPMGIMLDTPQHIHALAAKIKAQSVTSHAMPIGNLTHMTDAERAIVGRWIAAGAPIPSR